MRLIEFWRRMHEQFGAHAEFLAADHVFAELGNRTVNQALDAGEDAKLVWRGVCEGMQVPVNKR
jgi:hypothetical protein